MNSNSATIKVITRDNPIALSSTLASIRNDVCKQDLDWKLVLIDDSMKSENQNKNRRLLAKNFGKKGINFQYFGHSEFERILALVPEENRTEMQRLIGFLSASGYRPSRPKNISQLMQTDSSCELLIDDDVLIGSKTTSFSIIQHAVHDAYKTNSLVSSQINGFPDISSLQLLERSIVPLGSELHFWNGDKSQFSLSGGFLVYPNKQLLPAFPDLYNEDFIWTAFSSAILKMGLRKLSLNIIHSPRRKKRLSCWKLKYEAIGEIAYEALCKSNVKMLVKRGFFPSEKAISGSLSEYTEYAQYILDLLAKNINNNFISSRYLDRIQVNVCSRILGRHLSYLNSISTETIKDAFVKWAETQLRWNEIRSECLKIC